MSIKQVPMNAMSAFTSQQMIARIYQSSAPVLVAFSGGKDSVAMVLHLLEMGISKDRIHLHHHDVDGDGECFFDWACTRSYCQAFADAFKLKIFYSYRKGGILREIYRNNEPKQDVYFQREPGGPYLVAPSRKSALGTRMRFPAQSSDMLTRWCSSTVKIDVIRTAIAFNDGYLGEIFVLTGERREESASRKKLQEVEDHKTKTNSRAAVSWRPIIDWTEWQVWDIMRRWSLQPHPAYMLGWNRCSCQLCIFGSANIWATIQQLSPGKVDKLETIEKDIRFTLYPIGGIREKIAQGTPFKDMDVYWIHQALNAFTAPIIADRWSLPAGAFRKEMAGAA